MEVHLLDAATVQLPPHVQVVVVDSDAGDRYTVVDTDQHGGTRAAVRHLLDLGHRTVWHLAGPADSFAAQRRTDAWRAALTEAGRELPPLVRGDWSAESGYRAGLELAAREDCTAVFAANDQMALGLLRALHEHGRRVPEDVSVVGFDDIPEASSFLPPRDRHRVGTGACRAARSHTDHTERCTLPSLLLMGRALTWAQGPRASCPTHPGSFLQFPAFHRGGHSLRRATSRKVLRDTGTRERSIRPQPLRRQGRPEGRPPLRRRGRPRRCAAPGTGQGQGRRGPQDRDVGQVRPPDDHPRASRGGGLRGPRPARRDARHPRRRRRHRAVPHPGGHAAELPGRPGRARPGPHRLRQDPRLRPAAARPYGGPPCRAPQAARPRPRPHPGTRRTGQRRADPVRPLRAAADRHRRRRPVDRQAGVRAARRRRGRRRDAGTAEGPGRPGRLHTRRGPRSPCSTRPTR
ncbi:HTH-type transcriptional repressor PurR [Streptomyces griseoloalbus]